VVGHDGRWRGFDGPHLPAYRCRVPPTPRIHVSLPVLPPLRGNYLAGLLKETAWQRLLQRQHFAAKRWCWNQPIQADGWTMVGWLNLSVFQLARRYTGIRAANYVMVIS